MSKTLTILLIVINISGCATGPSVIEKLSQQSPAMVEVAVNPVVNLVDASIITYEETGKWPTGTIKPGKESKFSSYSAAVSEEDTLESKFRLSALDVDWISIIRPGSDKNKSYTWVLNGYHGSKNVVGLNTESINRGISLASIEEKENIALMFTMAGLIAESNKVEKTQFQAISEAVVPVLVWSAICLALETDVNQCRF